MVQNGRLLVRDSAGRFIWDTPWFGLSSVIAVQDLDGDGLPEVVAARASPTSSLRLFNGRDGRLLWTIPRLAPGAKSLRSDTVRLVDLDQDGRTEILAKPWPSDTLYAFETDPLSGLREMWRARFEGYANYNPPVVGDLDGDGALEVAFMVHRDLVVLQAEDGMEQLRMEDLVRSHAYDHLEVADLVGDEVPELLIIGRSHGRSVTVVDLRARAALWQLDWEPAAETALLSPVTPLGDLDGDGQPELVLAVFNDGSQELDLEGEPGDHDRVDAPGVWSLLVLDVATGRAMTSLEGWVPEALVNLDGDGRVEVLARASGPLRSGPPLLSTMRLLAIEEGSLQHLWEIEAARLLRTRYELDPAMHDKTTRPLARVPALSGEPRALILVRDSNGDGAEDLLERYVLSEEGMIVEASVALPEDARVEGIVLQPPAPGEPGPGSLYLSRNDGSIEQRGADLSLLESLPAGDFVARPVVATLPEQPRPMLYFMTSNGWIEALSISPEAPGDPPRSIWRYYAGMPAAQHSTAKGALTVTDADHEGVRLLLALADGPAGEMDLMALDAPGNESYLPRATKLLSASRFSRAD